MIDRIPRGVCLIQPDATLVVHGVMPRPVMGWGTDYRGQLHINAAIKYDDLNRAVCNSPGVAAALWTLGYGPANQLPMGCYVGRATLADCRRVEPEAPDGDESEEIVDCRDFRIMHEKFGRYVYIWEFTDPVVLVPPLAGPGRPGICRVAPHVADAAESDGWLPTPQACVELNRTTLQAGHLVIGAAHDRREGTPLYPPRPILTHKVSKNVNR